SRKAAKKILEFPTFAVFAAEEAVGFGRVAGAHVFRVPFQLLAGAVGDVAEVVRLREPAGVFKVGRGRRAGLASLDPFGVVTRRARDGGRGALEADEFLLGQ